MTEVTEVGNPGLLILVPVFDIPKYHFWINNMYINV